MRLRHVLIAAWLWWFLFFLGPVNGASVTITNNVIVSNAYGKLTATSTMQTDMFAVYTNGTVYFDVHTTYTTQASYTFTAQAYGNGTFTVRFKGPAPFSTVTGGHLPSYNNGLQAQDIVYSGGDPGYGQTGSLTVNYRGIKPVLQDAAYVMAAASSIILTILFADYARDPFSPERPVKMKRIYYSMLGLSLATATLFILSSLFT